MGAISGNPAPVASGGVLAATRRYLGRRATWQRTAPALVALGARLAVRRFRPADAVAVGVGVALYGPLEWVTHHSVLHGLPLGALPGRPDTDEVRSHLDHHADPHDLERLFVPLRHVPPSLLAVAGAGVAAAPLYPPLLTLATTELALMAAHYWLHYLMHADAPVPLGWFGRIRDNHLRHHFEDGQEWRMGVLCTSTDRIVGTSALRRRVEG